jgi:rare lipoprotein A
LKSLTKAFIISVMILLVGFTVVNNDETGLVPVNDMSSNVINDQINEVSTSLISFEDQGEMVASWYGPRFHGKLTANGEIYDQDSYTAAHKKYSFGTLLKVTNPRNHKSIIVRINDRGPYIKGRELDLSKASATALGMMDRGVIKVKVEQLSLKGANFPVITLN